MMIAALFSSEGLVVIVGFLPLLLGLAELGWTTVKLDGDRLFIQARPSLLSKTIEQVISSSTIRQVFVVERAIGRHEIHLILADRRSQRLSAESLGGDLRRDVALYFEAVIEGFLGLPDRPVPGEIEAKSAIIGDEGDWRSLDPKDEKSLPKNNSDQERWDQAVGRAAIPAGFEVIQDEKNITISWRERRLDQTVRWMVGTSLVFCVTLLAMILIEGNIAALATLLAAVFVCLACFAPRILPYFTWISIRADRRDLCVSHKPSLFRQGQCIPVNELRQIYVAEHCHTEPWTNIRMMPRRPYYNYHLTALAPGSQVLAVLEEAHCALFLERELESFLAINDRRQSGEPKTKYAV
ncbi:MAG: hypothetical protein ACR2Q4_04265 [Geminicoccaceae bacterium]